MRMVGGCSGNKTDRFGTSLKGGMVVQEGGQGSERWNEAKRRRQNY